MWAPGCASPASRYILPMRRPLEIAACRSSCRWEQTEERIEREQVYACKVCGSEWVASQLWTPIDSNGVIPEAVHEERRRGRG